MFIQSSRQIIVSSFLRSTLRWGVMTVGLDTADHARSFARARPTPPIKKEQRLDKEEYKQSILEQAQLRKQLHEKQQAAAVLEESPVAADQPEKAADEETAKDGEISSGLVVLQESEAESDDLSADKDEDEPVLTEKELFAQLTVIQDINLPRKPYRYIPFVPREDDDDYRPPEEKSYIAGLFEEMEEENRLWKETYNSLYDEEEVSIKLVHFTAGKEKEQTEPVILRIASTEKRHQEKRLYLRRMKKLTVTKTKLFDSADTENYEILKQVDLDVSVHASLSEATQRILDMLMELDQETLAEKVFDNFESDPEKVVSYFEFLSTLLPDSTKLPSLLESVPRIVLPQNREALEIGMTCAGTVYPCLYLIKSRLKRGLSELDVLEDVLRVGSILDQVYRHFGASKVLSMKAFIEQLENASEIVPNFAKVLESVEASVTIPSLTAVVRNPELATKRIEICKSKIYNWQEFNLYAFGYFTLSENETKFTRFCEMYNMTRRLQYDFAETTVANKTKEVPDVLYFWKQNWMRDEQYFNHRLPNGVLPPQFTAFYNAFEILELEGLTWSAFVKGLSILSEQSEVGVYDELHFYEKLRKSRPGMSPSHVLRDGLADVIRMMCHRGQIRMENEPTTLDQPLFELTPIVYAKELYM